MPAPFKYKSAQLVALIFDQEMTREARQARLEALRGPRQPYERNGPPRSGIHGCPHVSTMTAEELREEAEVLLAACVFPVPPRLTPTGRLAKHQGLGRELRFSLVEAVRSAEIRDELRRRDESRHAA
jgi:hypothetical protein